MNKKILVADDSVTIQRVVELTFSDQGYDVTCLGNARDVMTTAKELRPDLVLLDVSLPDESGYDLCKHLKEDSALGDVPVMLLSGTFEPFDSDRARIAGASGHLTKPFESQVLISRVSELIQNPPSEPVFPEPAPPQAPEQTVDPVPLQAPPAKQEARSVAPGSSAEFAPEMIDAIARRVVEQLSDEIVREVAWEVVPELAERLVLQRLRQIEEEAES